MLDLALELAHGPLEVAAHDPQQGVVFYKVNQLGTEKPQFKRDDNTCLQCHLTWDTLGVPGFFLMSTLTVPDDPHSYASGFSSDHRRNFDQRWGGWMITAIKAVPAVPSTPRS